jgi:3-hydroxybutyryl-CoA dehydrogenase
MKMIKNIAVIGAGQMGAGIAHLCALANYDVQVIDISQDQLTKAQTSIEKNLDRQMVKGSISLQEKEQALNQLVFFRELQTPHAVDLVIEAVSENSALKIQILQDLDKLLQNSAILASNTSSLSITALAEATRQPDRVIGMHFMNPAPLMPLVEIIRGARTSDATYATINVMVRQLGKTPVSSKDAPGFIVNRILMPMINEAIYAVYENIASPEDIDTAMKLGTNQPMGPLELADFIGLDTCLSIMHVLHQGFKDDKYRPCPLLADYVTLGRLGKKTGLGFYKYKV